MVIITKLRRSAAIAVAGVSIAGAAIAFGTPGVAHASTFCGTESTGTSSWSTTAVGSPHWSPLRTVFVKRPPGCHDFQIVSASGTGGYAGYLKSASAGTWTLPHCANGYVSVTAGVVQDYVLCTNVATGADETVDTLQFPSGATITADY
jgi:hypothetical protein